MSATSAVVGAVVFLWLGMVLAISFIEAPLKFRAPGVTLPLGLGIGRIVFRALNVVEIVLAVAVAVALVIGGPPAAAVAWAIVIGVVLAGQLGIVRPRLNRRSDRVLAGENAPRSHAHLAYVGLELVKVVSLIGLGVTSLAGF